MIVVFKVMTLVVFATIAMVPQKSLFETYVHEYAKQASHGCIHAEPVNSPVNSSFLFVLLRKVNSIA